MNWLEAGAKLARWTTANNWPLVVLAIALVFRKEIKGIASGLLSMSSRVTRLGPLELLAQGAAQSSALSVGEQMFVPTSIDVLDDDVSLKPFYDHFADLIEKSSINSQERYARAVRAWAFTIRARVFDEIARTIFETQVAGMRKLTQKPSDKRGLRSLYDEYVHRALESGADEESIGNFEAWIQYPESKGLVEKVERGRYEITSLGSAFLAHLDSEHSPRPLAY